MYPLMSFFPKIHVGKNRVHTEKKATSLFNPLCATFIDKPNANIGFYLSAI